MAPDRHLLVRGSYGIASRAPDLHHVFAGPGTTRPAPRIQRTCRLEGSQRLFRLRAQPDPQPHRQPPARPETSTSWSAGLVWSPAIGLDLSVDWFDIDMRNQVQDMDGARPQPTKQLPPGQRRHQRADLRGRARPHHLQQRRTPVWRARGADQRRPRIHLRHRRRPAPSPADGHRRFHLQRHAHLGEEARFPALPRRSHRRPVRGQQWLRHSAHQDQPERDLEKDAWSATVYGSAPGQAADLGQPTTRCSTGTAATART
ncbi:TonB-dependent receptor [Azotobacter sp. CWF10]